MKFNWKNAVILAVICAVIGCAVALTYSVAGPRIVQKAIDTANEARQALFPEADSFEEQELPEDSELDNCYAALKGGEVIGYTGQITVSGSQGMIEVISGLDADGKIVGINVGGSSFSETPGLGAKTKEADFTDQFKGLSLPAALKENVDGVTGATISSSAVVSGVNKIGYYIQSLSGSGSASAVEDKVFGGLLPGATTSQEETAPEGIDALWTSDAGAVVYCTRDGRNGPIQVQVGVGNDGTIVGVKVNEETLQETAGLGDVVKESYFLEKFLGKNEELVVGENVDAASGATISSVAVIEAVNAAREAALPFLNADGPVYTATEEAPAEEETAEAAETGKTVKVAEKGVAVQVIRADEWAEQYPDIYASYMANESESNVTDYVADYPMISAVYEGMAFNTYYSSARGHVYTVTDITETGRPHKLANCFSCKTADYSVMVNEQGDSAYSIPFEEAAEEIVEPISCYSCHANEPGEFTISNTYLADAMGDDLENVDPETLSCAQCHVEYYFGGENKATMLPYTSLADMNPDDILDFYNNELVTDGVNFADYTNPRTGVRQIKVQHPEFETFMGEGSVHAENFTCADCHMGEAVNEEGETYVNHNWTSPLENEALIENTCSQCHADLAADVEAIQEETERRTYAIGFELEALTEKLALAVESGDYTEDELNAIRAVARDAQFYWDFVFVENSEGAHNSTLTEQCLDKAETLFNEAMGLFHS